MSFDLLLDLLDVFPTELCTIVNSYICTEASDTESTACSLLTICTDDSKYDESDKQDYTNYNYEITDYLESCHQDILLFDDMVEIYRFYAQKTTEKITFPGMIPQKCLEEKHNDAWDDAW